jgi:ATP-binding cassette subfamily C (CFTR/MRP) protein 1
VSFAVYTAIATKKGTTLDASRLFTSLSFLILLSEPLFYTFNGVIDLMSAVGCFNRIQAFLLTDSRPENRTLLENRDNRLNRIAFGGTLQENDTVPQNSELKVSSEPCVYLQDASFGWGKDSEPTVKGVNIIVQRGQLTALIGPVASGKSTLLKGILGETPVASGLVQLCTSKIAWCQQSAWLTVRL